MFVNRILDKVTAENGKWVAYGNDGRHTTDEDTLGPATRRDDAGIGWRARFTDDPNGGDYGWGPLGGTREEAIINLLAERLELAQDELEAERA
jgi:hypothetical protein